MKHFEHSRSTLNVAAMLVCGLQLLGGMNIANAQTTVAPPALNTTKTYQAADGYVAFTVPAGANVVTVVVNGAGGAYGGDDSGWGGSGASGSTVQALLQVDPSLGVKLQAGGKGNNGVNYNYTNYALPGGGGAGGAGLAAGGNGGNVGLTTSGGGGGGGAASILQIGNMLNVVAGGGGGGGGGSSRWIDSLRGAKHVNNTGAPVTVAGVAVPVGNYVVDYGNYGPDSSYSPTNTTFTNLFPGGANPAVASLGTPYALSGGYHFASKQPAPLANSNPPGFSGAPLTLLDYTNALIRPALTRTTQCANAAYPDSVALAGAHPPVTPAMNANTSSNGGGGGGSGGTYSGQLPVQANYGLDSKFSAEGGLSGASCYLGYPEAGTGTAPVLPADLNIRFGDTGGGAGGTHPKTGSPNTSVEDGLVTVTFGVDPLRIPTVTSIVGSNGSMTVTVAPPVTVPPGQTLSGLSVTCTAANTGVTVTLPAPATGGPITFSSVDTGAIHSCAVTGTLVDSVTSAPTINTLPSAPTQFIGAPAIASTISGDGDGYLTVSGPDTTGTSVIVTGYMGVCSDGTNTVPVSGTQSPLYVPGLTNGNHYSCNVVAQVADHSSGTPVPLPNTGPSNAGLLDPIAIVPPLVTGTTSGVGQGTVSFDPPSNVPPSVTVTGYTTTCTPGPVSVSGASPVTVSGLTNGTVYNCTVTADLSNGKTTTSTNSGQITPHKPIVPPSVTGTISGDGKGTVSFNPPTDLPPNVTVTGYTTNCNPGNISVPGASPVTIPGLSNGTTYTCSVTADLSDGTKSASTNTGAITPRTIAPPVITGTKPGDSKGTLTIQPPGDLPTGVTVTDYTATCNPGNITAQGVNPLEVKSLTNGTTYTCSVVANLSDGTKSPVSNDMSVTPSATAATTATPVPMLDTLGLILMSALASVAGALALRRKVGRS